MSNSSSQYTYVTLWTAFRHLKRMYEQAWADPDMKDEALALRLAALNMSFFSLEAFLNHLIQAIRPDVWSDERKCFSGRSSVDGEKYYGPLGKLQFVHVLCGIDYDEDADAIQTAAEIKKLRDMMAHGQTYEEEPDDISISQIQHAPALASELFVIATHELLMDAFQHFDSLRCSLFDEAKVRFRDADLGFHPSLSISGSQVISVVP